MYISITWLKSFLTFKNLSISKKLKKNNLLLTFSEFPINKFTLTGFEVEKINLELKFKKKNIFLNLNITPNNVRINQLINFINEIKIIMNFFYFKHKGYKRIKIISEYLNFSQSLLTRVKLIRPINFISLYQLNNINLNSSPLWLKKRLLSKNIKPVNNYFDIKNYIKLEWGKDIRFYDLDQFNKFFYNRKYNLPILSINLRKPNQNEQIIKINKNFYEVKKKNLILTLNNAPINIIGINNNIEKIITNENKKILIEITNNINNKNIIFQHLVKLLYLNSNNFFFSVNFLLDFYIPLKINIIKISFFTIRKIIGETNQKNGGKESLLTNLEILTCLKKLDYNIIKFNKRVFEIDICENKKSVIESEKEIIEEIGRIYGFNNLKSNLPNIKKVGKITLEQKLMLDCKKFLIQEGFNEVVNYSFKKDLNQKSIKIINPLSNDYLILQTSLLNNLLDIINYNKNQQNHDFSCFEIARIFNKEIKKEFTYISAIYGVEKYKTNWNKKEKCTNWNENKEIINKIFQLLNILNKTVWNKTKNFIGNAFHNGKSAIINYKNVELGTFTTIDPFYAKDLNLLESVVLVELNLTQLSQIKKIKSERYKIFSLYPRIRKDISVDIIKAISVNKAIFIIKRIIRNLFLKSLRVKVEIFDNYQVNKNHKTRILGFKMEYHSVESTLKQSEIETLSKVIFDLLKTEIRESLSTKRANDGN